MQGRRRWRAGIAQSQEKGRRKKEAHSAPMVARAGRAGGTVLDTDFPPEAKFDHLPDGSGQGVNAFLTVQEGCDKFCTFCVVPYTRGAEFSRPVADVLAEARRLADAGAREVMLLGQNVNAYHGVVAGEADCGLGDLIRGVAAVDGIARVRYTTSYPAEVDAALIAAHREVPELMPFLHLPVQSGSDRVLAAMNRRHTADQYRQLADRLRQARPDLALASDFIVGFPGESDADFADTMQLIEDIEFAQAFSFKYSPRPGTPAAENTDQVPDDTKAARLSALQSLLSQQQKAFNQASVGLHLPVLLTGPGRHEGQMVGRSPYLQPVHLDAPATDHGKIVMTEIKAAISNSLSAVAIDSTPESPSRKTATRVDAH